jgi:putative transcriptional regulator
MMHPSPETLRSYVHAEADVTTRLLVEAHLSLCPSCSAGVADDQRVGEQLPDATLHDELDLPPFDRMWTAVTEATVSRRCPEAAVLPPALLAALPPPSGWRWVVAWPERVKIALLIRDADTGSALYLCHFAPGSTFPRHRHIGLEENVVLAGGYRNGDMHVDAGDWVIGAPGTEEMPRTEPDEECWCLSRIEPPGVRFTGWRRWVAPLYSR